ncbi:TonB-dependent receptor [Pedobacter sp. BS3]|uniref:outer membrane beta-barrel family protein n=1 Tax=Pedobacter sp. BS3 TaxID=2567937 RepID=UPI0011ECB706|nr:outer membrane beta-barrel family protein [Pedobacter sp. BS3]TZF81323.1 TonB-dependent receptor [Pedobacter sp. BS3]
MKFIYLLISALFLCNIANAQIPGMGGSTITGRISGSVTDSLTRKPLDYATVTLYRSKGKVPLNGTLTDEKGNFKFDNVSPGNYKVTITFIGYSVKTFDPVTTTAKRPDKSLGTVILAPGANLLNAVSVTGEAPVIENRVDKTVYNAEKDATVAGGNAGDVLRKVPMVSVDQDGNVSLRGSQSVKILINGKPSGAVAASAADAMKMLPADQIKSVEVITSPSAKYDAEGSAGIINIITKKKEMSGVSGSVSGGMGTRQNNGNANLNVNHNRLSVSGNFGGNLTWPQTSLVSNSISDAAGNVQTYQDGTSRVKRYAYVGSGNVAYDFNKFNSVSTGIRFNQTQFSTDGNTYNQNYGDAYNQSNDNTTHFGGFDWNADYTRKFKKDGHEVTLAGQWSYGNMSTDFSTLYDRLYANQKGNNDAINDEYTIQLDYSLPITDKFKLEAGGKTILRDINSDNDFYKQISGEYTFNNVLSNNYDYSQDVYAGYTVLTYQLKNGLGLQGGARVENTRIEGSAGNPQSGLSPFSNSYTTFIPSVSISKTFKKMNTFRLSYSKRIQRPGLQYLNPFRNVSNIQYQTMGNPYLSPEITQNVELNYSTFIKTTVINASVYYKHTSNIIESFLQRETYTTTDADGNEITIPVSLTTFNNTGSNNSFGGSFFGQIKPVKNVTLRTNINLYSYKPAASGAFQGVTNPDNKTYLLYNMFASGSYELPKSFVAETFVILNAPRRTMQGKYPSFSMWVLSFNKQILNKKGKIGINVIDPFNERKHFASRVNNGQVIQQSDFAMPFRSVGVNFSWSFGKMNFNPQQKKKRGVNNDDLKQGDSQGGQGGAMGN